MAAQNVAVEAVATPLLIGGASLAGRRFGHHVGGWLLGPPMTSGPLAFFLATDHGVSFAGAAAVGMLAGTSSQVAFALAYRSTARRGAVNAALAGCAAFAAATTVLSFIHWSAPETFALVVATLIAGYALAGQRTPRSLPEPSRAPRWDIPVRMVAATTVVVVITAAAPTLGSHLAGLLSPFPVFAATLAVFTHHTHGPTEASQVLDGLLLGLLAPAVFFVVLAFTLQPAGLLAFVIATAAALGTQAITMLAMPRDQQPTFGD